MLGRAFQVKERGMKAREREQGCPGIWEQWCPAGPWKMEGQRRGDRTGEAVEWRRCRSRDFILPLFLCQGYVLRGWVDLSSDKPHTVKKSIKYLEHGIQDTKDVLGLMGKVGSGEARGGGVPSQGPQSLDPTWWMKSRGPERARATEPPWARPRPSCIPPSLSFCLSPA